MPCTALYMPGATRTQVYLTAEQRARIVAPRRRDGRTLADVVRAALDAYLANTVADPDTALRTTFSALPALDIHSRDEWDRDRG